MRFSTYIFIGIGVSVLLGLSPLLGALFAAILYFRKNLKPYIHINQSQNFSTPSAYHHHLFSLMGYLAKADGLISPNEIQVAQDIMKESGLNYAQKTLAKSAFREGSQGLNLNNTITFLKILSHTQPKMVHTFLAQQERIIHADTHKSMQQINILNQIKFHVFSQQQFHSNQQQHRQSQYAPPTMGSLQDAYRMLGIKPSMDFATMKKTYRKLIGKHHPDRQRTEQDKKTAEEKIKQYQKAWKVVQSRHQPEAA